MATCEGRSATGAKVKLLCPTPPFPSFRQSVEYTGMVNLLDAVADSLGLQGGGEGAKGGAEDCGAGWARVLGWVRWRAACGVAGDTTPQGGCREGGEWACRADAWAIRFGYRLGLQVG